MSASAPIGKAVAITAIPAEPHARRLLRHRLADAVESMIALIDALDADPDAEDGGDAEPSLGWTRTMAWGATDDREENKTEVDAELHQR